MLILTSGAASEKAWREGFKCIHVSVGKISGPDESNTHIHTFIILIIFIYMRKWVQSWLDLLKVQSYTKLWLGLRPLDSQHQAFFSFLDIWLHSLVLASISQKATWQGNVAVCKHHQCLLCLQDMWHWYRLSEPCQALQSSGGSLFSSKRSQEKRGKHLNGQQAGVQTHPAGSPGLHLSRSFSSAPSLSL